MLGSIVQVRPQQPFPLKIQECRNVLQEEISGPYRNAHHREYSARDCAGKILKKLRVNGKSIGRKIDHLNPLYQKKKNFIA